LDTVVGINIPGLDTDVGLIVPRHMGCNLPNFADLRCCILPLCGCWRWIINLCVLHISTEIYLNPKFQQNHIWIETYLNTLLNRNITTRLIYETKYLWVHLNMKVNRQTSYFLIKRSLQCQRYHSLYVSLYVCVYVFISCEIEREKMVTSQTPSYNQIED
jgi:hypothetical protein